MIVPKTLHLLFVYGTLTTNQPNHFQMTNPQNGNAQFIAEGTTVEKFPLVIGTRYNIPFLLDSPGLGHHVHGEIYLVDSKMLANLDIVEGYPDFYDRAELEIKINDETLKCWVYIIRSFKIPETLLKKKHLEKYRNTPEKPYVEKSKRDPKVKASEDLEFSESSLPATLLGNDNHI